MKILPKEPLWSKNIKKGLAYHFQLDHEAVRLMSSLLTSSEHINLEKKIRMILYTRYYLLERICGSVLITFSRREVSSNYIH